MRATNQALGRALRHQFDFGTVFLLDYRYTEKEYYNLLPKWVKSNYTIVDNLSNLDLIEFYDKNQLKYSTLPKTKKHLKKVKHENNDNNNDEVVITKWFHKKRK